jgi:hypothetical protein
MGTFTDTRMIWAAAWVDSWDALKESYQRILKVGDPARRAKLIAELANLPIELHEVEGLPLRAKAEAGGNVEEWRAKERIAWAAKFRKHFSDVGRQARGL